MAQTLYVIRVVGTEAQAKGIAGIAQLRGLKPEVFEESQLISRQSEKFAQIVDLCNVARSPLRGPMNALLRRIKSIASGE